MIYKVPNVTDEVLSEAADLYVSDVEVADLPTAKKRNAQNLTLALYSIPVENEGLQFHISANRTRLTSFPLPSLSSEHGVFSLFYPLEIDAEETIPRNLNRIVPLTVHTNITSPPSVDSSNSTIYLVPPTGTSIISDIDDILRLTKIWDPPLALNNTFIEDYKPWSNMPVVYKNWERRLEKPHFHYLSTVPMPGSRRYMEFIYDYYPVGSFESRPGNYTSLTEMRGVREKALRRYLGSFGQRRVVLVGDVSNRDVISGYAALAKEFDRVVSIPACYLYTYVAQASLADFVTFVGCSVFSFVISLPQMIALSGHMTWALLKVSMRNNGCCLIALRILMVWIWMLGIVETEVCPNRRIWGGIMYLMVLQT